MPKAAVSLLAFNRGEVSRLGLSRVDLSRMQLSAEIQENWMPRVLGSMMFRPGSAYIGLTDNDGLDKARFLPFIRSLSETALLEFTDRKLRIWVDEAPIEIRVQGWTVTNGTFDADLTGWTDGDETGAASSWATGGYMSLVGTGFNSAIRSQEITLPAPDTDQPCQVRIVVARGSCRLRIGSTDGGQDYREETTISQGTHSISFTPGGDFWIWLANARAAECLIDSVSVEAAGVFSLAVPYVEDDLEFIRYDQSVDVVYLAASGYAQYKIERRSETSWSFVDYLPEDGPFNVINTTDLRLTPSGIDGSITLDASRDAFTTESVGALYKLTSAGQKVTLAASGDAQFTDPVRISGVGESRAYTFTISGTFVATWTLQQSVGEPGAWIDIKSGSAPYTETTSGNDGLDNQITYYRLGIKGGDYTSGTADLEITYGGGSRTGVVRVTAYVSRTQVEAVVLKTLGGDDATQLWYEGIWSDRRGYPSAVVLYEGRLWWAGKDRIIASVSDAFESFDDEIEGDSGPIVRSVGSGPVDTINWLIAAQLLLVGGQMKERAARSSAFDEPLTPTNFNLKSIATLGSAAVNPVVIDTSGLFVQRSGTKVYELSFDGATNYTASDLMKLATEIGDPGIVAMAVQREPDTRVHCVRADGQVAVLVYDPAEEISCWVRTVMAASGRVEDVVVMPGTGEDIVYYVVNRNGVRCLERLAREDEARGGTWNKLSDCHITASGSGMISVPVPLVLRGGQALSVWADGVDRGLRVASGGAVSLNPPANNVVIGLPYQGRYKSRKLVEGSGFGAGLTQRKRTAYLGVIGADIHAQGIKYGPNFDDLDDMPLIERGQAVDQDKIWEDFDTDAFEFPGSWVTDNRVCILAESPKPATLLALVVIQEVNDKA